MLVAECSDEGLRQDVFSFAVANRFPVGRLFAADRLRIHLDNALAWRLVFNDSIVVSPICLFSNFFLQRFVVVVVVVVPSIDFIV